MNLKDLNKKFQTLKEEIKKTSENAFNQYLKENVFNKMPELQSVGWKQYANYFCDGGPCDFYVHDYTLELNGISIEEEADLDESFIKMEGYTSVIKAMQSLFADIDAEIFEMAFGSDQHIVIHRDGKIENNSYQDHE